MSEPIQLPTLATQETQRLRSDYPSIEHLEAGNVAAWLVERQEQLLVRARDERTGMNLAKLLTIAGGAVGAICYATSPLAPIGALVAGVGYIWSVAQDMNDSHQFAPIPFVRGSFIDFLQAMGDKEARVEYFASHNELVDLMFHLDPFERYEFGMLKEHAHILSEYLTKVESGKRFYAYRWLFDWFVNLRGTFPCFDQLNTHLATVTADPRVNYQQVTAIQEYQTQIRAHHLGIPPTKTTSLPETKTADLSTPIETSVPSANTFLEAIEVQVVEQKPLAPQVEPPISSAIPAPATSAQPEKPDGARTAPNTKKPLPPFDRDRIINESKGLMIIGDMGAAKTCVAQHIANGFDGYGIIVFDPHGKTDWGNAYVITKMGAIYEQMRILLDLLENGDTTPLLIICDEWLEIRGDRRNKKGSEYAGLAYDFIRLFSTKPRKFNKLAAFVLHSPNVEAAGVDSFLRENYLKVYLGRLAKKEFSQIQDCAYPCVLEDEQQEHPTHGHHTEFKPHGKAPRNLQPLSSAPINIPLAYMKGSQVEVCERGWDTQLRLEVENIRQRLELLLDSSTPEPNPEPGSSAVQDSEPLNRTPEPPKRPIDEGCTDLDDGSRFRREDGEERFTPLNLTREQVQALVQNLNPELNQTQIIERLWQVKKGGSAAWKEAREQFKQLTGE